MDQHFSYIRDLENTMTGMAMQCSLTGLDVNAITALNTGTAFRQNGKIEDVAKLQMDLVGLAFSCNMTRVATLQVGDGTDHANYVVDGVTTEKFHYISHRQADDGSGTGAKILNAVELHTKIDRIRMGTFKYLLDRWKTYSTPNGPLLDNAFAMRTSHVANGPSHSFSNLPIIIAGSAGGYLEAGQYVDGARSTNGKLLTTLVTAAGGRSNGGLHGIRERGQRPVPDRRASTRGACRRLAPTGQNGAKKSNKVRPHPTVSGWPACSCLPRRSHDAWSSPAPAGHRCRGRGRRLRW